MKYRFSINQRLLSEILAKYRTTFAALCELINNAVQASATEIRITIDQNSQDKVAPSILNSIVVRDNGVGISQGEFKKKFIEIATDIKLDGQGIGRFAALQIGRVMELKTIGFDQDSGKFHKTTFRLTAEALAKAKMLEDVELEADHSELPGKQKTFYEITISDFYDETITKVHPHKKIHRDMLLENISEKLFWAYPEIIFNKKVSFFINDKVVDPQQYVIGEIEHETKTFTDLKGEEHTFDYSYVHLNNKDAAEKIFLRVRNNNVQTIAHSFNYKADIPDENQWFIYLDSDYLDNKNDMFRNLEMEMDEESTHLRKSINQDVSGFFAKKYERYSSFIEQLKADAYYPYKKREPSSQSKAAVFNQIAFYVEEEFSLIKKKTELRKVVYGLIDKSIGYGDIQDIIVEILKMDAATIERFKNLLKKVELEEVIQFCESVAKKSQFLDFLHSILYEEPSQHLKERKQLHKIIEKNLWLFGEKYGSAPHLFSDKKLAKALDHLRGQHLNYEVDVKAENANEVEEPMKNITDLFFYNENFLDNDEREIMIVELKAPICCLSQKELNQVDKYAFQLAKEAPFPKTYRYKIILVGNNITEFAKSKIGTIDPKKPSLYSKLKGDHIEVFVMPWADIIASNRARLSYLANALKTKDRTVKEVFESDFSKIDLGELKTIVNDLAGK